MSIPGLVATILSILFTLPRYRYDACLIFIDLPVLENYCIAVGIVNKIGRAHV